MTITQPQAGPPCARPADPAPAPVTTAPVTTAPVTAAAADRAPTLAHVAQLAGVSSATASRVLSGSARVSRAARLQVEEAVERLGYVRRGSATRTGASTGAIAAVLRADSTQVFADPFYAGLLWGMRRELDGRAQLVILMVGRHREWRVAADYLRGEHLAGVLLVGARQDDPTALVHAAAGVPVLLAGRPLTDVPLPYVDVDNRGGALAAVRHLLAAGRRTIATIAGPADLGAGVDRLAGYRLAAAEAGLNVSGLIAHGDFGRPSGEHAMSRLLARRPDLDAVLAASDPMALGALEALRRAGRRVPDDVAVIGFDDAPIAQRVRPRLTTVRQPVEDFGARLVRELRALIAGRPITDRGVVLRTKLIVRDSA